MDKFVIRKPREKRVGLLDPEVGMQPQPKHPTPGSSATFTSDKSKMKLYKSNLTYNPKWKEAYHWMEYDEF